MLENQLVTYTQKIIYQIEIDIKKFTWQRGKGHNCEGSAKGLRFVIKMNISIVALRYNPFKYLFTSLSITLNAFDSPASTPLLKKP